MELMKQNQYSPLSVAEMAVSLFAVENSYIDEVPLEKIGEYEGALVDHMNEGHGELMQQINESGAFDDSIKASLKAALDSFSESHSW